jgi:hypothetical protein
MGGGGQQLPESNPHGNTQWQPQVKSSNHNRTRDRERERERLLVTSTEAPILATQETCPSPVPFSWFHIPDCTPVAPPTRISVAAYDHLMTI